MPTGRLLGALQVKHGKIETATGRAHSGQRQGAVFLQAPLEKSSQPELRFLSWVAQALALPLNAYETWNRVCMPV